MSWQERTVNLIGEDAQEKLSRSHVAVFGLGGVGSYAAEAFVRAGVGKLTLVDGDTVSESNLNRQLIATRETIGRNKAEIERQRALSINPAIETFARAEFYTAENASSFPLADYDYICCCIDMVRSIILLTERAQAAGTPIILCMGAGNKLDPTSFSIAPIEQTSVCPLARVVRRELKARGLSAQVVYSKEPPKQTLDGSRAPGSISFVPGAAGLAMAGAVIRALAEL